MPEGLQADSNVVRLDRANEELRERFLRWQCRIRQIAMRTHGGRPTSGMTPLASAAGTGAPVARVVTVLCRQPEHSATMELRHMVRRTHDPAERRKSALEFLAERYYQAASEFSDILTASFSPDSGTAAALLDHRECRLAFEQFSQRFDLHCTVRRLSPNNPLPRSHVLAQPAVQPPVVRRLASSSASRPTGRGATPTPPQG